MMRKLFLALVLISSVAGAQVNDRTGVLIQDSMADRIHCGWILKGGDWSCDSGRGDCTCSNGATNCNAIADFAANDKIVLISDGVYYSYKVYAEPGSDTTLTRIDEAVTSGPKLRAVSSSVIYLISHGLHATDEDQCVLHDGSGNDGTVKMSQSGFTLFGSSATNVLALKLINEDEPASGEITQTVRMEFKFFATTDGGTSYHVVNGPMIEAYKVYDHFESGGTVSDQRSGIKFYTMNAGTQYLRWTMDNAGQLIGSTLANENSDWGLVSGSGPELASDNAISWSSTLGYAGAKDLIISRQADGVLELDDSGGTKSDGTGTGEIRPGSVVLDEILVYATGTIADGDTTPDVSGANVLTTSDNTGATAITDLDNPTAGAIYYICIGGTGANASTITDGGNFALSGNWTPGLDDCITLLCQADNDYVELARSDN